MQRYLYGLSLFLLTSLVLSAQSSKYLEMTIEDTIIIHPTSALYQIILYDKESFSANNQEQTNHLLDKAGLEKLINEWQIQISKDHITRSAAQISHPTPSTEFVLLIENIDLLQSVQKRLKEYYNAYGNVLEFRFETVPELGLNLMKKCIDQGVRKAQRIGKLVGKEIGELLVLEEEFTRNEQISAPHPTAGWTFYPPLSALPNEAAQPVESRSVLRKRVKLRFAWN